MCDNCREASELAKDISEQMQTGERVREFYRRQGEARILERLRHYLEDWQNTADDDETKLMVQTFIQVIQDIEKGVKNR